MGSGQAIIGLGFKSCPRTGGGEAFNVTADHTNQILFADRENEFPTELCHKPKNKKY